MSLSFLHRKDFAPYIEAGSSAEPAESWGVAIKVAIFSELVTSGEFHTLGGCEPDNATRSLTHNSSKIDREGIGGGL